jgi:carboxypeptidase PM20D1
MRGTARRIGRIAWGVGLALGLVALVISGVALGLALRQTSRQLSPAAATIAGSEAAAALDQEAMVEALAATLRAQTIAGEGPRGEPIRQIHALLRVSFPCVHRRLEREVIGDYDILYTWRGQDEAAAPVLVTGSMLVAPAGEKGWTFPPFGGVVAGGAVWGRGAAGAKGRLVALMGGAEALCLAGYTPQRTLLVAIRGRDEGEGVAAALVRREVLAAAVIGDGPPIRAGLGPGLERGLAIVTVAEKGAVELVLSARGERGAVEAVAAGVSAIAHLEEAPEIEGLLTEMIGWIAPELPWAQRIVLANPWLPILFKRWAVALVGELVGREVMMTSRATVGISSAQGAGERAPGEAEARVSVKIGLGSTVEDEIARCSAAVAGLGVAVAVDHEAAAEPRALADPQGQGFLWAAEGVRAAIPGAIVAPGLASGPTKNRGFLGVFGDIVGVGPLALDAAEAAAVDGVDERVSIAALMQGSAVMAGILRAAGG